MNEAQEHQLAAILRTRPDLFTPEQEELARVQHQCRLRSRSSRACEQIRCSVTLACSECILAAGYSMKRS